MTPLWPDLDLQMFSDCEVWASRGPPETHNGKEAAHGRIKPRIRLEIIYIHTGTGLPHSLGTPVRHSSSNDKINAASSSLSLLLAKWSLALQFRFREKVGTPVPQKLERWHSSSNRKIDAALQESCAAYA